MRNITDTRNSDVKLAAIAKPHRIRIGVASLVAALLLSSGMAWAGPSDAFKQFSVAGNPHGPWSYLSGTTTSTEALLTTKFATSCFNAIPHTQCWWSNQSEPNSISIIKNKTKKPITFLTIVLPIDHLSMDPEADAVTVEWRTTKTGNYQITGDFTGTDTSEHSHPVQIAVGRGTPLFSGTVSAFGQSVPFNFTVALTKGQAVDFDVLTGSDPHNLSTGLRAIITPAP